jgi:hypothetical protein
MHACIDAVSSCLISLRAYVCLCLPAHACPHLSLFPHALIRCTMPCTDSLYTSKYTVHLAASTLPLLSTPPPPAALITRTTHCGARIAPSHSLTAQPRRRHLRLKLVALRVLASPTHHAAIKLIHIYTSKPSHSPPSLKTKYRTTRYLQIFQCAYRTFAHRAAQP